MSKLSEEKCQEEPSKQSNVKKENSVFPESPESPELGRKLSRTAATRDDGGKFKSMTLDRMGKMFKLKSNRGNDITNENDKSETGKNFSEEDEQSRKEKTNSLGRMLKLVDKNGEPRKLFNNSRGGTLTHMFRRKSTGTQDDESTTENSNSAGLFSRIFNQWKNRSGSGNATGEPNVRPSFPLENKSSLSKQSSNTKLSVSSACAFQTPAHPAGASSVAKSADIEYPA